MMLRLSAPTPRTLPPSVNSTRSLGERVMIESVKRSSDGPIYAAITGDFSGEFWPDLDLSLLFDKGHIVACPPNDWFKRMVRHLYKPKNPVER